MFELLAFLKLRSHKKMTIVKVLYIEKINTNYALFILEDNAKCINQLEVEE
jgi:hypothetical protein